MRKEIIVAGFGGQGVIKAALLLSAAAGIIEGREVAQTQSYGPEARGGACRSEVVISDERIDYPKALRADYFLVMSQPALDRYRDQLDPKETLVIADGTLVRQRPENMKKFHMINATEIAEQQLGRALFANIVLLGAFSGITAVVSLEALTASLHGQRSRGNPGQKPGGPSGRIHTRPVSVPPEVRRFECTDVRLSRTRRTIRVNCPMVSGLFRNSVTPQFLGFFLIHDFAVPGAKDDRKRRA